MQKAINKKAWEINDRKGWGWRDEVKLFLQFVELGNQYFIRVCRLHLTLRLSLSSYRTWHYVYWHNKEVNKSFESSWLEGINIERETHSVSDVRGQNWSKNSAKSSQSNEMRLFKTTKRQCMQIVVKKKKSLRSVVQIFAASCHSVWCKVSFGTFM